MQAFFFLNFYASLCLRGRGTQPSTVHVETVSSKTNTEAQKQQEQTFCARLGHSSARCVM